MFELKINMLINFILCIRVYGGRYDDTHRACVIKLVILKVVTVATNLEIYIILHRGYLLDDRESRQIICRFRVTF